MPTLLHGEHSASVSWSFKKASVRREYIVVASRVMSGRFALPVSQQPSDKGARVLLEALRPQTSEHKRRTSTRHELLRPLIHPGVEVEMVEDRAWNGTRPRALLSTAQLPPCPSGVFDPNGPTTLRPQVYRTSLGLGSIAMRSARMFLLQIPRKASNTGATYARGSPVYCAGWFRRSVRGFGNGASSRHRCRTNGSLREREVQLKSKKATHRVGLEVGCSRR
ncbi:hypothetical protein DFH09DRAFT_1072136 [Mycena vulgaris]|nr:hypothetical protein DFH09DRAFT_1072136 [Mycena vulgaris]